MLGEEEDERQHREGEDEPRELPDPAGNGDDRDADRQVRRVEHRPRAGPVVRRAAGGDPLVDPAVEKFWMAGANEPGRVGGVDLYIGGVEHAVLHLLYARFWHKVLYDLGHVSTPEPFQRLYNQGYILADAYSNSTGRYVPAAEVERIENERYRQLAAAGK